LKSRRPKARRIAAASRRSHRARPATRPARKNLLARKSKARAVRATTPARSSHALKALKRVRVAIPSPLATRHVAPPRPAVIMPARSMPPAARDYRKPIVTPVRLMGTPETTEEGVLLAITYSIREGRRNDFFALMRELKPLLSAIGGNDCMVFEDRSRPNYFMEVFRFKDEAEFTAFDDKFHKDRKIAAVYALLDDIVEAEKSDFKIFERKI
jgi:hypothetical protein